MHWRGGGEQTDMGAGETLRGKHFPFCSCLCPPGGSRNRRRSPDPGAGARADLQQQISDSHPASLLPRPRLAAAEAPSPCCFSLRWVVGGSEAGSGARAAEGAAGRVCGAWGQSSP